MAKISQKILHFIKCENELTFTYKVKLSLDISFGFAKIKLANLPCDAISASQGFYYGRKGFCDY